MSTSNTPGLQVQSRQAPKLAVPRHRAAGPGVRWTLSADLAVRFNREMTRVYLDAQGYRTVMHLRYLTPRMARPSDLVLALLLQQLALPAAAQTSDWRCWILQQTERGWTLTLEVHNSPFGRIRIPVVDPLGAPVLDLASPHKIAELARTLWQAADRIAVNPEGVTQLMLRSLQR